MTDSQSTADLLNRLRSGDRAALETLLQLHRQQMRRAVDLRMDQQLRQRIDASDVIQEAQIEVVNRIDEYLEREPMPFHVWLHKTAYQQLLRLRRAHVEAECRGTAKESALPDRSSILLIQRLGEGTGMPLDQLLREETHRRVKQALNDLGEADREILLLRTVEGMSNAECAQVLEIDAKAANNRYARALIRLQQVLAEQQVFGSAEIAANA